jgi:thiol-disulfide isomerase/thioredoxin
MTSSKKRGLNDVVAPAVSLRAGHHRPWVMTVMRRRRRMAVVVAALVSVILAGCSSAGGDPGSSFSFVSPGGQTELTYAGSDRQTIGQLSGSDLTKQDATISLSDYSGKVVVLNFWGSWCAPCRAEADGLNEASMMLSPAGVQFLGVDVKDTREGGADFHTSKKVSYPSIFDPSMRTLLSLRGYPASAIPSTIVLDRSHRVSHVWLLPVTRDELVAVITPLLAEKN